MSLDTCHTCGRRVEVFRHSTLHGAYWSPQEHDAPCGSPCLGGGIPPALARTRAHHGGRGACPCKKAGA